MRLSDDDPISLLAILMVSNVAATVFAINDALLALYHDSLSMTGTLHVRVLVWRSSALVVQRTSATNLVVNPSNIFVRRALLAIASDCPLRNAAKRCKVPHFRLLKEIVNPNL